MISTWWVSVQKRDYRFKREAKRENQKTIITTSLSEKKSLLEKNKSLLVKNKVYQRKTKSIREKQSLSEKNKV